MEGAEIVGVGTGVGGVWAGSLVSPVAPDVPGGGGALRKSSPVVQAENSMMTNVASSSVVNNLLIS